MNNARQHNLNVASTRMWSVISHLMQIQALIAKGCTRVELDLAVESYQFECRRYQTALYALTTTEAL